jgi:hypothetical protein
MYICMQETIAQLTRALSAAQEKLLQAEQVSNQRMDELEAAHAQLQVIHLFWLAVCFQPVPEQAITKQQSRPSCLSERFSCSTSVVSSYMIIYVCCR